MKYASLTHVGLRRKNNEDALLIRKDLGLFVVADGMGGHDYGEVASKLACQVIEREVALGAYLEDAIKKAHKEIKEHPNSGTTKNMGTTVVAVILKDNNTFQAAWVGDSRIYQIKRDGRSEKMIQVSHDHTPVQDMVDAGLITAAQARTHSERNIITQALGECRFEYPYVDTVMGVLNEKEALLLCTDGLNGELEDQLIHDILGDIASTPEQICQELVDAALQSGGNDNVTVAVIVN